MDTISRYLTVDYLVTFLLTLLVLTFVMTLGAVVRAIDLVARGLSGLLLLRAFLSNMPFLMTFSIPMSGMTAVLLLFGRLSLDGEITAMKSSGMTIWQISAAPIILSILLSLVCLWLSCVVAPHSHFARRRLLREVGAEDPINLLEEGRFVKEFPGLMIYVGRKSGPHLRDIIVYEMDHLGVKRNIRAREGTIRPGAEKGLLLVDLTDVRIHQPDREHPGDPSRSRHVAAEQYPVTIDFSHLWKSGEIQKRIRDMTMTELIRASRQVRETFPELEEKDIGMQRMKLMVEANKRLGLSLSCFAFTLLGIPLGMRSRRKESSIGVAVSLGLVFFFYLFVIIAEALVGRPEWHPDLIIWIPVLAAEVGGFFLMRRLN